MTATTTTHPHNRNPLIYLRRAEGIKLQFAIIITSHNVQAYQFTFVQSTPKRPKLGRHTEGGRDGEREGERERRYLGEQPTPGPMLAGSARGHPSGE
ncbi:hypothetical protein RRG08_053965 [Elysia crispata]|uniref:Uncharacterized protein n=1 Tax=Elysia crispata TaxID=231223 RepID=A0AAE1DES4_9GAST|nr:hypothetical protein RRG08_053965 [Elysia crispata]